MVPAILLNLPTRQVSCVLYAIMLNAPRKRKNKAESQRFDDTGYAVPHHIVNQHCMVYHKRQ